MSDAITGLIRTWVPVGVGAFLSWLLAHNITIDADSQKALTVGLTAAVIAVYYLVVRLVEPHLPTWLRVLLAGVPKTPTYRPLPESDKRGFSEPSPN